MRLNHVLLPCADVARSLAFYEGLGLTPIVLDRLPDGMLRYARLVFPEGEATLSLEQGPPGGPDIGLYFECEDLDSSIAALGAAGTPLASGPEMKPWLWREAIVLDPDKRRLCLFQAGRYRRDPPWRISSSVETLETEDLGPFLAAHNHGYADAAIPSARDTQIAAYLERLRSGGSGDLDRAAGALGPAFTATFLVYAERMATLAVREHDTRHVLLGLRAVALTWRACADVRPAIPVIGLLYDATRRAGGDPERIFAEAAAHAPVDGGPVLRDFLTRGDLEEIADEMGFVGGRDRDGFRYRRTWGAGRIDSEP